MKDLNVEQIKKLWILDLIVITGSLKQAALTAQVSPSAVSQSLTALEKSVGKRLVVRNRGTELKPTQDALQILELIRPAFAAFDQLKKINHSPAPKLTWLNFGTYESIAIDLLPGLLHALRLKLPNLKLGLRISRTPNLLTMVRKGELCSALITEVEDLNKFYRRDVAEDRLGIYISRGSEFQKLGLKAIDHLGLGTLAPGKDGYPSYYRKFMRRIESRRATVQSDSFEALRTAAVRGAIVTVLPNRVARRTDELSEIELPKSKVKDEIGLHRISIVSQLNCDREEADFLADLTSELFQRSLK